METASWIEDFKPTADDPENVHCRLVVQQYKNFVQRRHAPWNSTAVVVETLAQLWQCPNHTRQGRLALWGAAVAFFHSPLLDEGKIHVGPPRGLRRQGRCWGEQASCLADSCTKS